MIGIKINQFDKTRGTIEEFNSIFNKTKLRGSGYVEILDIVDSVFVRNITVNNKNYEFDFGESNFKECVSFKKDINHRFKYYAKDLHGENITTAYNFKEMAEKLGCSDDFLKKRILRPVTSVSGTKYRFNITRREL